MKHLTDFIKESIEENINNFYEKYNLSEEEQDNEKLLKLAADKF